MLTTRRLMCNHKCVALRVHGIEIYNKRKPLKLKNKVLRQEQKKPTETVAPTLPSTANGVKVASLRSSRPSSYALDTLQGLDVLFV